MNKLLKSKIKLQYRNAFAPAVVINSVLAVSIIGFIFLHIINANIIAADTYKLTSLSGELSSLHETNSALVAQKADLIDRDSLVAFAEAHNMVVAQSVGYIFERNNVALGR